MDHQDIKPNDIDLVWGAPAIGQAIGVTTRQAFYLLQHRLIPAKKIGTRWCATREDLRRHFSTKAA